MQRELDRLGADRLAELSEGDTMLVYVVSPEDKNGNVILSLSRAQVERDWREAQDLFEAGKIFPGKVAGFNKGGLIVRMGKLRGFVPASQLSRQHQGSQKQQPEERWSPLVGSTIQVKIIEINRKRKRLILSERAAQRLHLTQSAVSQRIKQLEERLGQLVIVRGQPLQLTVAGERLLGYQRQQQLLQGNNKLNKLHNHQ